MIENAPVESPLDPADFVGPGTSMLLLDRLAENERSSRLVRLAAGRRRLHQEAPALGRSSSFFAAYDVMKSIPGVAVDQVVRYPGFGRWISVLTELLAREAHIKLPDGHAHAHLTGFGRYALSAAVLAGIDADVRVVLDERGRLWLPATGKLVQCHPCDAALPAECSLSGGRLRISITSGRVVEVSLNDAGPAGAGAIIVLPKIADIELNDADPDVAVSSDKLVVEELSAESIASWQTTMRSALELLASSPYAPELARFLKVLVPLKAPADNVSVSSSAADSFPMIQMSWHSDPYIMAETLVHEYHHNKLNALMTRWDLLQGDPRARYYSPWRDEPRPTRGLLHGVFAFHSVVSFRHWYASKVGPADESTRYASEWARRFRQTMIAVEELNALNALTPVGKQILAAVTAQMEERRPPPVDATSAHRIEQASMEHRRAWEARHAPSRLTFEVDALVEEWLRAGGAVRTDDPSRPDLMPPETPLQQAAARSLGIPTGIPTNRRSDARVSRDHTLDRLGRLSVVDPAAYDELAGTIRACNSEGPLATLLQAHVDYVAERFEDARGGYERLLVERPDNIDVWRFYAFALQKSGFLSEATAFLFRPELITALAERITLDAAVLDRLCAEPRGSASLTQRTLQWLSAREP